MGFSKIQDLYKIPHLDLNLNIFKMHRNHLNRSKTQNLQTNTDIFFEQMESSITLKGKMLPFSDQSLADTPSTLSSYHHHHTAKPVLQVSDLYLFKIQTIHQHISKAECRNRNKSTANKYLSQAPGFSHPWRNPRACWVSGPLER